MGNNRTNDNVTEKEIWKFEDIDKMHTINIFERSDNILFIKAKGIGNADGLLAMYDFFVSYSKSKGKKIKMLGDFSKFKKVDVKARTHINKFFLKNGPVKKIGDFGLDFPTRTLIKLIFTVFPPQIPYKTFKKKEEAVAWHNGN